MTSPPERKRFYLGEHPPESENYVNEDSESEPIRYEDFQRQAYEAQRLAREARIEGIGSWADTVPVMTNEPMMSGSLNPHQARNQGGDAGDAIGEISAVDSLRGNLERDAERAPLLPPGPSPTAAATHRFLFWNPFTWHRCWGDSTAQDTIARDIDNENDNPENAEVHIGVDPLGSQDWDQAGEPGATPGPYGASAPTDIVDQQPSPQPDLIPSSTTNDSQLTFYPKPDLSETNISAKSGSSDESVEPDNTRSIADWLRHYLCCCCKDSERASRSSPAGAVVNDDDNDHPHSCRDAGWLQFWGHHNQTVQSSPRGSPTQRQGQNKQSVHSSRGRSPTPQQPLLTRSMLALVTTQSPTPRRRLRSNSTPPAKQPKHQDQLNLRGSGSKFLSSLEAQGELYSLTDRLYSQEYETRLANSTYMPRVDPWLKIDWLTYDQPVLLYPERTSLYGNDEKLIEEVYDGDLDEYYADMERCCTDDSTKNEESSEGVEAADSVPDSDAPDRPVFNCRIFAPSDEGGSYLEDSTESNESGEISDDDFGLPLERVKPRPVPPPDSDDDDDDDDISPESTPPRADKEPLLPTSSPPLWLASASRMKEMTINDLPEQNVPQEIVKKASSSHSMMWKELMQYKTIEEVRRQRRTEAAEAEARRTEAEQSTEAGGSVEHIEDAEQVEDLEAGEAAQYNRIEGASER